MNNDTKPAKKQTTLKGYEIPVPTERISTTYWTP